MATWGWVDEYGNTPLMVSLKGKQKASDVFYRSEGQVFSRLWDACRDGCLQVAKDAIDRGADVNTKDYGGITPLILTSVNGHTAIAKLLLDNGADINAKDDYGDTPLMDAARRGYTEVAKLLIDRGADINITNCQGHTAISHAFDIKDKDKRQEMLELFNNHCPEAFMSGYMDWSVGR